jgi:hypothetical protein
MSAKSKYKKLDFSKVKKCSLKERKDKVSINDFAKVPEANLSFAQFLNNLPGILMAKDFKQFIQKYIDAINANSMILFMMGAHLIKVGITPLIIDAMKRGWIKHIAMNGAGVIHDVEIAIKGSTSEDVQENLQDGSFGMVKETSELINQAVSRGKGTLGYGEAVARALSQHNPEYIHLSLLASAYNLAIPVTVHSAIGTEIIHQHPEVNGAAVGDTCWTDFQIFTHSVSKLREDSIVINAGSAVIMPELFLKALTVTRNLGYNTHGFTTANFDMITHYRPLMNVVKRPTKDQGKGYNFIGHHEIMLPLLFCALKS